ncbi:MAG: TRAP transporter substrate-binding protein DctP [Desulfohalobiaceae bacterium]|nr:TRAP transporter substrate-binding protein DctP [Desulfohalobiaceae bacterium]
MNNASFFKKLLGPILCLSLVLVLISASSAPARTYTLKAVSAWPKTVYEVQNYMKLLDIIRDKVEQQYPGELKINYIGGPEVFPNREQVEAARNGLVDMVFTTVGYYVSAMPVVDGLNLTELTPWEERKQGVNAFLNELHQQKVNCFYLGRMGTGLPFSLYLNEPIDATADLKGLKIRCSPSHIPFLKEVGATPQVIPPPDVYTALERGVVDGFIWPAGLITDWGWHEVVDHMIRPSFYEAINVVLVNHDAWQDLPKHLQNLLIEAEKEAEHYTLQRAREQIKKEKQILKEAGLTFIDLPQEEGRKLVEAAYSSLWDQIIEKAPQNGPKLKGMLSNRE